MVRLKGPGLARDASGTLADTLIFSKWKGVSYLKQHASPKQPRTAGQIAMRAMMKFLSEEWAGIIAARKETWNDLATDQDISPFNAYQQINLDRWRNFHSPSQIYPAPEAQAGMSVPTFTATGDVRHVNLSTTNVSDPSRNWGFLIYHQFGSIPDAQWDLLDQVVHYSTPGTLNWKRTNLQPGLHGFRQAQMTWDGRSWQAPAQTNTATATVT